jgi:hypothetical protein
MKFILDSPEYQAYPRNAGDGNSLAAARLNSERCIYIEQSQMGSTRYGGDDLVMTTRPTSSDEIEIDRGTRGRVAVVGCL